MRVISGSLGSRSFNSPHGHRTHPMSEKIRGAIFNVLGDISGLSVLDLFSGSGALAIEAVSRGAASATAIEVDSQAHRTIKANVDYLGLTEKIKATKAFAEGWSHNNPDKTFDLVFMDPPYDKVDEKVVINLMNHTKSGGICVLSLPPKIEPRVSSEFELLSAKDYGDARVFIYRR